MSRSASHSLADVARLAGVSLTTASRHFNEPGKLRPSTRARIAAAVDELDYMPSAVARALASNRSRTIGAVIPTLDEALFSREIKDTGERLAEHGYALVLASGDYEPEQEFELVRTLLARGVDGLLLVGILRDPAVYALLERSAVPYVTTWTIDPGSPHPQVGVDYRAAAHDMASHLLGLGHRRFGLIDLPVRHNDRATGRLEGFRAAIKAAGATLPPSRTIECAADFANGEDGLRRLMALPEPPTAVLCGADVFALGALLTAPKLGLRVPRDISISGFDNHGISSMVEPALTTVELPVRETGLGAADFLLDRLAGRAVRTCTVFDYRLVPRGSTGPAPGMDRSARPTASSS